MPDRAEERPGGPGGQLAYLLSGVGSPFLVLPLFCVLFVARAVPGTAEQLYWGLICLLLSTFIPGAYVFYLWRRGRITDLHVSVREQRGSIVVVSMGSFSLLLLYLWASSAPRMLQALAANLLLNAAAFGWISRSWKISLHAGVLGGCLAGAVVLLHWPRASLFGVIPVIWARWYRRRHSLAQGFAGAGLGILLSALVLGASL